MLYKKQFFVANESMETKQEEEKQDTLDIEHPKEFCCPIGLDLMTEPVMLS